MFGKKKNSNYNTQDNYNEADNYYAGNNYANNDYCSNGNNGVDNTYYVNGTGYTEDNYYPYNNNYYVDNNELNNNEQFSYNNGCYTDGFFIFGDNANINSNKSNNTKRKKNKVIGGLVGFGVLLSVLILSAVLFLNNNHKEQTDLEPGKIQEENNEKKDTPLTVPVEENTPSDTSENISEDIPEDEVLIEYEKPNYDFKIEEFVIELDGISKEYTIAWVSDVHIVADKSSADDLKEEFVETIDSRRDMFKTKDEEPVYSVDLWPEIVKYLNYNHFDGIVLGGDLMDYCSRANMDAFTTELNKLNPEVPLMYIRADHDYGFNYGGEVLTEPVAWQMHADEIADHDENGKKFLEFDDFVIIGINKSTKNFAPGYYDWVEMWYDNAVSRDKDVIVATHVPYESKVDESLEELSMQVRNKIYYWGGGSYIPYEDTKAYLDTKIYAEDTAVKSVLAGHMHHSWEGNLTEKVNQHIFTPAFEGCIGIVRIKPPETE